MITPEKWPRVRDLFHRALACSPEERAAFLQAACDDDDELRAEVESLLEVHPQAEGFLAVSPVQGGVASERRVAPPRLTPGTRLGSFEVLGPLGAGGMGEVYRARDTRLDRLVALKVLSSDLAADPRGQERFEREARVISKLTHPQICTLFDVGSATVDGRDVRADGPLGPAHRVRTGATTAATAARPWQLHAAWAAAVAIVAAAVWWSRPAAETAPPANPRPVIVLMDSPLPGRVYDPRTLAAGGTNADDVTDALRDLPVLTRKENTSLMWHREEQVRAENPDLIISHLSCLLDARVAEGNQMISTQLFDLAQNRLTLFFGYLSAVNPAHASSSTRAGGS